MKPISEVYDPTESYGWGDYWPMIESMGYDILCRAEVGSYQGDSLAVVRDGERYGLVTFGWGSCSGCDALQACRKIEQVDELRTEIHDQIVWKDSRQEMLEFLKNRDWKAQYYSDTEEVMAFVAKAIETLDAQ